MGNGVVDSGTIEMVPNFDPKENAQKVAESIRRILELARA
jgi:hypothetical protein